MSVTDLHRITLAPLALLACTLLVACSAKPENQPKEVTVSVQRITPQRMAMEQTLPGRTVAFMNSDVRPQVSGIIQKRLFIEGELVKAGQVLYQIDPAPYQAAYDNARGVLAQAEATVISARPKANRYEILVKQEAISQQDGEDALSALRQAEAAVVAARAGLQAARINLDYTRISAPIAGRIGISTYTPGALVSADQATALTTIQQMDPIYVDVSQTSAQLLALRKQLAAGGLQSVDGKAQVSVTLEDGSTYAHTGTLEFVGTAVDPGTGNVTLRAVVPNPDGMLLPGMYVRAVLPMAINDNAILVPQSAVSRNSKGEATVKLVGADGKVLEQVIQVGDAIKDQWVVTGGLTAGQQLIVANGSKASAGDAVKVQPASAGGTAAEIAATAK